MQEFDDIRPYHDDEVKWVVQGLLEDLALSRALAKFRYPKYYRWLPGPVTRLVQSALRQELRNVTCVHDVQIIIEKYLDKLIETTTHGLTQSGLQELDSATSYLFISNHRDITMDPALVNYMLYHHGFDTLQIAIGDNLLKRPFLSKLMKLNKSFLVKRSVQGRDKLAASKQLSGYINYCIATDQSVWIAQREGRAKDGLDRTEPAVLKMLHMAERDSSAKLALGPAMTKLNIVPVAISYEYDPCDVAKAQELYAVATEGRFIKDENSDVQSILTGMIGLKGAVHVSYGKCLEVPATASAEQVAELIDRQIISNYRLHPSNYFALQQLQPQALDFSRLPEWCGLSTAVLEEKRSQFEQRMAKVSNHLQTIVLQAYANPVLNRYGLIKTN
jgi:1-acyl-sn-glycerol-3-phosphate acyltransferase